MAYNSGQLSPSTQFISRYILFYLTYEILDSEQSEGIKTFYFIYTMTRHFETVNKLTHFRATLHLIG